MSAPLRIGRYALHDEIASGGMAAVHFGQLVGTAGFQKIVAIKRLHRILAGEPGFRNAILSEARLAARIRHPNVVPPLDVLAENGELLLVMEYVHGEPLSRLLRIARKHGERVPLPVASAIITGVLHGLHAAHEARSETGELLGLVHRDVSPQNVIVGADGVSRVIDFGIAKAITSRDETMAGTIKGKVPYLAPEQISGNAPVTRKVDIYAASVTLWEMLAGQRLFEGPDDNELLRRIVTARVPPPSGEAAVDAIVLAGLAQNPDARFATARDMALALESAAPPATPSQVAAWVDRLAGEALEERMKIVHRIEAPDIDGFQSETLVMNPMKPPQAAPATARLQSAVYSPQAEIHTPSGLNTGPQPPPATKSKGPPIWPVFPAILIVLVVAAWFALPFWAERKAKEWGTERGLTLTFDKVSVSRKAIRFSGVHVTSREMPEMDARATAVVVGLSGTTPESIAFENPVVTASGTVKDVGFGVGAWYKTHTAALKDGVANYKQLSVANGKMSWTGFAGPKTEASLEGITVDVQRQPSRAFGEDWHAIATKVLAKAGDVQVGPWQLQSDREGPQQHGSLRFDTAVENTAAITFTMGTSAPVVSLRVPPTKLTDLHIPPPDEATADTKITGAGDLTIGAVSEGGTHGTFVLGATALKAGDDVVDATTTFKIQDENPIDAPVLLSPKGASAVQAKVAGDVNGGRLSLFGRSDCTAATKNSYEVSLVLSLLPPSDSRLGLEPNRCPGK